MIKKVFLCIITTIFLQGVVMSAEIPKEISQLIEHGEFSKAQELLKQEAKNNPGDEDIYLFEAERLDRVRFDYKLTEDQVREEIKLYIPDVTLDDVKRWTDTGYLWTKRLMVSCSIFRPP